MYAKEYLKTKWQRPLQAHGRPSQEDQSAQEVQVTETSRRTPDPHAMVADPIQENPPIMAPQGSPSAGRQAARRTAHETGEEDRTSRQSSV
jgi:hypothetical protein